MVPRLASPNPVATDIFQAGCCPYFVSLKHADLSLSRKQGVFVCMQGKSSAKQSLSSLYYNRQALSCLGGDKYTHSKMHAFVHE